MTILLYDLVGEDAARPFSPHCWKTAFALAQKGLEFQSVPTRFLDVSTIEDGTTKTVPLIRDGGKLVADSFEIAVYLDDAYPDRPTLFGGEGGRAATRFVERWSQLTLHTFIGQAALMDIHDMLGPQDRAYFRKSREERFGKALEEVPVGRDEKVAAFRKALEPLRTLFWKQPFIGGDGPLFGDYIVAGALQWARVSSPFVLLEGDDPVAQWFERCLDLHGGLARRVPAAA
ncbi:glutathione S-transferase family protein [Nitratireductor luteus]|uniref:glutathione S-transferase family protein n=1 Tax=Nitratireductor luteus TaxID=2976980 RepID=UPI00223EAF79|nr:glutathione S-transferase family protein [Nitratireductor luteus]